MLLIYIFRRRCFVTLKHLCTYIFMTLRWMIDQWSMDLNTPNWFRISVFSVMTFDIFVSTECARHFASVVFHVRTRHCHGPQPVLLQWRAGIQGWDAQHCHMNQLVSLKRHMCPDTQDTHGTIIHSRWTHRVWTSQAHNFTHFFISLDMVRHIFRLHLRPTESATVYSNLVSKQ